MSWIEANVILDELAKLKTGPRDLRKFGLMVGGAFAGLALALWLRHSAAWPWVLTPAAVLFVLGGAWPQGLKWVYVGWMALAFALGHMVSTLLLTLLFYLVVTPIGWLARCLGRDFLDRKWSRQAPSYWIPRDPSKARNRADYERQF
jgi:hypothetical protein